MPKTLLVVGAGFGQLPAIEKARNLGLRVIVVDRNAQAVGMHLADACYEVDIIDPEGVLQVAKKEKIDGILTLQSDHGVPAVGYVNDQLGLCGISYQTAIDCSIKSNFRDRLAKENGAQPLFFEVASKEEALEAIEQLDLPVVVKATDSSGSRGITRISNLSELDEAIKEAFKCTRQDTILIEEFVEGVEFGAQTFSVNGKCEVVLLHNDTLSPPPFMIPTGHSFPFDGLEGELLVKAIDDIKSVVEAIGIHDGPANIDVILDDRSKRVKVIEIGARIGATCLPELVHHHTGIDWVEQSILSAMGETPDLKPKKKQPVAAEIFTSPVTGVFQSVFFPENKDDYKIVEYEVTVAPGDEVSVLRKGTDRIGKVLTYGSSVLEAESNAERFIKDSKISVQDT